MDKILEFTGNHPLLVLALVVSFLVAIFSELRRKASGTINIEASDAVKLINNGALVVDLRSAEAYGRGHIVTARSIPHDELEAKSASLTDKARPIVAVCDNGISSTRSVNLLRKLGYESVYGLKGGMNGWTQAGLPVVTGKKTKSKPGKGKKRA
jgi:rhodanese-related sulfurtransferase